MTSTKTFQPAQIPDRPRRPGAITAWMILTIIMTAYYIVRAVLSLWQGLSADAPSSGFSQYLTESYLSSALLYLVAAICSIIGLIQVSQHKPTALAFTKIYHCIFGFAFLFPVGLAAFAPVLIASTLPQGFMWLGLLSTMLLILFPPCFYFGYAIYFSISKPIKAYLTEK